jgi:precorrin-3B C17-methyltransferase
MSGLPVLRVVGLGPGDVSLMTPAAGAALAQAALVVGYKRYIELIPAQSLVGKRVVSTGMTAEVERCREAISAALAGEDVALVCSGDPGVYGMAGLVLELVDTHGLWDRLEVEIVPGVPAVTAAAALLGAPLMHDFAVISLSDLLTPWELIEKRISAAAEADFVLAIYNPRSRKRDWQLPRALDLVRAHRSGATPLGVVRQAYRPEQSVFCATLKTVDLAGVDMFSLLVIGNSQTRLAGGRMITPRGYHDKYEL